MTSPDLFPRNSLIANSGSSFWAAQLPKHAFDNHEVPILHSPSHPLRLHRHRPLPTEARLTPLRATLMHWLDAGQEKASAKAHRHSDGTRESLKRCLNEHRQNPRIPRPGPEGAAAQAQGRLSRAIRMLDYRSMLILESLWPNPPWWPRRSYVEGSQFAVVRTVKQQLPTFEHFCTKFSTNNV